MSYELAVFNFIPKVQVSLNNEMFVKITSLKSLYQTKGQCDNDDGALCSIFAIWTLLCDK